MLRIPKDSKVERLVEKVWRQHTYGSDEGRCSCGKPLTSHDEADLHFDVEVFKAGMKAGAEQVGASVAGSR